MKPEDMDNSPQSIRLKYQAIKMLKQQIRDIGSSLERMTDAEFYDYQCAYTLDERRGFH